MNKSFFLLSLPIVLFGFAAALFAQPAFSTQCAQPTIEVAVANGIASRVKNPGQHMFPAGVSSGAAGKHLKFSFESEYLIDESAGILRAYAPSPDLGVSLQQWQLKSDAERVEWLKQNLRRVFPDYRSTTTSKLRLVNPETAPAFLPRSLILDDTGNVEFVLAPLDTFQNWTSAVTYIHENFGAGSMQATVGVWKDSFLGLAESLNKARTQKSNLGYLRFVNELDTFDKLVSGFSRYTADPSKPVAQSFQHPFLGPMTRAKFTQLIEVLDDLSTTKRLKFEEIKLAVSENEASFKYFGGTAVRPDLDPNSIVLEIRDCHKNLSCLFERMTRTTKFMTLKGEAFAGFAKIEAFDAAAEFEKLDPSVRAMLTEVFPAKLKPNVTYSVAEQDALKVYRNFAWPMRDFTKLSQALNSSEIDRAILAARRNYVNKLNDLSIKYHNKSESSQVISLQVQGALTEFASRSEIFKAMKNYSTTNTL